MEFKDLVAVYFDRSNAMQAQWGAFITIALGLLAVFGTMKSSSKKRFLALILSLGFIAFAYENYDALNDIDRARIAARDLIWAFPAKDAVPQSMIDKIKTTITPPSIGELKIFHTALDIIVLVAIWGLTLSQEHRPDSGSS